ncbi:MAG: sulfotransferase [Rhodobacteraceae bacterium]|nr:sulfotransferase [Paracoccaceae bacterium]
MKISESQRIIQNATRKLQQGKPKAAAKAAQAGAKKFPKNQELHNLAGTAFAQARDHNAAAKAYSNLYRLAPETVNVRITFGISLIHAGRFDIAQKLADEWLETEPENPNYRYLIALAAMGQNEFETAETEATRALVAKPEMERLLAIRGLARFELNKFESALQDFQNANDLAPDKLETLMNIGFCFRSLNQNTLAIEALQKCADLFPNDVSARTSLAKVLEESGELQQGLVEYNNILKLAPDNWTAISRIVENNSKDQNQAFVSTVRKSLDNLRKNSPDEILATLSMASLLSKIGNWPEAEGFYRRSNRLQAAFKPYRPEVAETQLKNTLALFPSDQETRMGGDLGSPKPIFIIGQPRSGTTLMELMISAHPDVIGLGEYGAIEEAAISALNSGVSDPGQHAKAYRSELPKNVDRFKAMVDKMPGNYMYLGFLVEAFPDAKFIHIERDPREVAFSMWKAHLAGGLTRYTSDFGWMAHAANLYRRYMLHWKTLYPSKILTVHYRDIVGDTENKLSEIADFCELDWHDSMLEPEQNKKTVQTASVVQARQKIHTKSLGSWEQHAELLQPFSENLDADLWPEIK